MKSRKREIWGCKKTPRAPDEGLNDTSLRSQALRVSVTVVTNSLMRHVDKCGDDRGERERRMN